MATVLFIHKNNHGALKPTQNNINCNLGIVAVFYIIIK